MIYTYNTSSCDYWAANITTSTAATYSPYTHDSTTNAVTTFTTYSTPSVYGGWDVYGNSTEVYTSTFFPFTRSGDLIKIKFDEICTLLYGFKNMIGFIICMVIEDYGTIVSILYEGRVFFIDKRVPMEVLR